MEEVLIELINGLDMKYNKKRKLKNLIHWSPEQMGFAIPEMVKTRDNCDGKHIEIKISI